MRFAPIDFVTGKTLNGFVATPDQQHQLGARVGVVSYDYSTTAGVPNAGGGEAVYVKASATIAFGNLVHVDKDWGLLVAPVTANTGRALFVAMQAFSATNIYGWVLRSGIWPATFSVAATVGPVGVGTAGNATPTLAAGKQILGATTLIAAAGTFTRTIKKINGSPRVQLTATDAIGIYPGLAISGTGIAGGTTVLSIDPDGRTLTMSANATDGAAVTATFTHTGFGIVHFEAPFVQGQIS